jgi:HEAT repeat protein
MSNSFATRRIALPFCAVFVFVSLCVTSLARAKPTANDELCDKALKQLRAALKKETAFIKVHAAEALLAAGKTDIVRETFDEELRKHGEEPHYRIGIWRVAARSTNNESQRRRLLKKLRDVSLDLQDPDRITATETLAKLQYKVSQADRPQFEAFAKDPAAPGVHFYRWLLAEGDDRGLTYLAELLDSQNAEIRGTTAYSLRHMADRLPPEIVRKLEATAIAEPASKYRVYVVIGAYVAARNDKNPKHFKDLLLPYARSGSKDEKYQTAAALAVRGDPDDLPLLSTMLSDPDADVRVSASNAILQIHCHDEK